MGNDRDDAMLVKRLIRGAASSRGMSRQGEEKIIAMIADLTQKKNVKRNPFQYLRFNRALGILVVVPVLLLLAASATFPIMASLTSYPRLEHVSGNAVMTSAHDMKIEPGYAPAENDRIRVEDATFCDIGINNTMSLRFFPGSELTIERYSASSKREAVRLDSGQLYLDKSKNIDAGKAPGIRLGEYLFVLEGTRALFQRTDTLVRALCFDGRIRIMLEENNAHRELFSLFSREKIEIRTDGGRRTYDTDFTTSEESLFDGEFREFPQFDPVLTAKYIHVLDPYAREESPGPDLSDNSTQKVQREPVGKKEPYIVDKIGTVRDSSFEDGKVNFIATASYRNKAYVLTQNRFYTIENDRLAERTLFKETPFYKIGPVLGAGILCLVSSKNLYLADAESLALEATVQLPVNGAVEYSPRFDGGILYVPISNNGYYTIDTLEPKPALRELYPEKFPVAPLVTESSVLVGSYFDFYLASLDTQGKSRWTLHVGGSAYSNPVHAGSSFYCSVSQNDFQYVFAIGEDGEKKNQWLLGDKVFADIFPFAGKVYGFYSGGELFGLDPKKNTVTVIDRVAASARSRNMFVPLVEDDRLIVGTDQGALAVIDGSGALLERIAVVEGEAFYAAPFELRDAMYAVSNAGNVYKIVKSGT